MQMVGLVAMAILSELPCNEKMSIILIDLDKACNATIQFIDTKARDLVMAISVSFYKVP